MVGKLVEVAVVAAAVRRFLSHERDAVLSETRRRRYRSLLSPAWRGLTHGRDLFCLNGDAADNSEQHSKHTSHLTRHAAHTCKHAFV